MLRRTLVLALGLSVCALSSVRAEGPAGSANRFGALSRAVAEHVARTRAPIGERRVLTPDFKPAGDKVKIAFFDADGTLRVAPSGKSYPLTATDVALLPMTAEPMKAMMAKGYLIAIASNAAHGGVSFEDKTASYALTVALLAKKGVTVHYFDFGDLWDNNHKPNPGMGENLAALVKTKFGKSVDWENSIMVGDSGYTAKETQPDGKPGTDPTHDDRLFAENLNKEFGGITYHHARDFFGWTKYGVHNFDHYVDLQAFVQAHPELNPADGR